jgi:hypothetical protein
VGAMTAGLGVAASGVCAEAAHGASAAAPRIASTMARLPGKVA